MILYDPSLVSYADDEDDVVRGCGVRKENGVYSECGTSPLGRKVEEFVVEGVPLPEDFVLPAIGVSLIELNGKWHVIDHVGADSYPNVADFIEEARRYGMSRRCEGIDYSLLTEGSMHILVHDRAIVANAAEVIASLPESERRACPHGHQHLDEGKMCGALYWHDVSKRGEDGRRSMPSFSYEPGAAPKVKPEYGRGIFAMFPISRLALVKGEGNTEKWQKVAKTGLHATIVDA